MSTQGTLNRQPAGTPNGGQFAAGSTDESGVSLTDSWGGHGGGDSPEDLWPGEGINDLPDHDTMVAEELTSLRQYARTEGRQSGAASVLDKVDNMPSLANVDPRERRTLMSMALRTDDDTEAQEHIDRLVRLSKEQTTDD